MWMIVMFDLPVLTKKERKTAHDFRNYLLDEGFEMSQFSVYIKFCGSKDRTDAIVERIKKKLPVMGKISMLFFTDTQFANIISFSNRELRKNDKLPEQYVLF